MIAFQLEPVRRARVWGGNRFTTADDGEPIGEVWSVWEGNRIVGGPHAGRTLGELAVDAGPDLLGPRARGGFPLLIKLLDTREWLSVQVHPDDNHAAQLEGVGMVGKTEAWHILDTEPDARIVAGLDGVPDGDALAALLRRGDLTDCLAYRDVSAGQTFFIPAGTIHALGPGVLVYEVQQSSDITYRVFDWNRPVAAGRALHVEQTLRVADPTALAAERKLPLRCHYFELARIRGPSTVATEGSFHAVTVIEGTAELIAAGVSSGMVRFDTVVVPACVASYELRGEEPFAALVASLP